MSIYWTSSLAYAVGLITTDGCLSKDGRHIEFTSKDLDQLETFKSCLNLKNVISWKSSGFSSKKYAHVQFGNVKLYRWLLSIGLLPRKSKRLGALNIPKSYFFDFLRGCLDGDGCIRTYNDSAYPNAVRLYVTFYSASLPFLDWINLNTEQLLGVAGYKQRGDRVWDLTYPKRASQLLLKAIYYRRDLPALMRKRTLAEPFLVREYAEVVKRQTRDVQGVVGESPSGFKSPPRHTLLGFAGWKDRW